MQEILKNTSFFLFLINMKSYADLCIEFEEPESWMSKNQQMIQNNIFHMEYIQPKSTSIITFITFAKKNIVVLILSWSQFRMLWFVNVTKRYLVNSTPIFLSTLTFSTNLVCTTCKVLKTPKNCISFLKRFPVNTNFPVRN